jgi:fluoride exporter
VRVVAAIAVAGAAGALARYGIANVALRRHSHGFPWGTFLVNVSGAFALGLIITLAAQRWEISDWLRSAVTIGFLGSYTTFSTFSLDTYRLAAERELGVAAANVVGSCVAALAAVYLGIVLARSL